MLQSFRRSFREEERLSRHAKTRRFETIPGEQMQTDFGETDIVIGGKTVRIKVFVSKMSYSRRIFAKAYFSEKLDSWPDDIESSFIFFGGLPRTVVSDNPKSLIKDHYAAREDRFNEKYEFFCNYYAVRPICTAVRKPNSKGKVESAVKYGEFSFQVQDARRSCGVLQRSIPVPFSTRGPSSAGCLSGTLPSSISHADRQSKSWFASGNSPSKDHLYSRLIPSARGYGDRQNRTEYAAHFQFSDTRQTLFHDLR